MRYILLKEKIYMKNSVNAIPSPYIVITTIVYALLYPIFFEMDNAIGEGINLVVIDDDKAMTYNQQEIKTECKSPCSKSAEMYIAMCA